MSENAYEIYDIGYNYLFGIDGYPLNYNKAFEYLTKSADSGVSDAMNCLGLMYQNGYGVNQNISIALNFYNKAFQTDKNAFAAYNLGALYYDGALVPKDLNRALFYFRRVVEAGPTEYNKNYSKGCYFVGLILAGNSNYYRDAVWYFKETLKYENDPDSWHNLGFLCEKGAMNVPKSQIPYTACQYYLKAAELGSSMSMDAAGRMYYVMGDQGNARYWIEKAADMGYKPAKKRLKLLNFSQSGSFWDFLR